jgi:hypothetical protein
VTEAREEARDRQNAVLHADRIGSLHSVANALDAGERIAAWIIHLQISNMSFHVLSIKTHVYSIAQNNRHCILPRV